MLVASLNLFVFAQPLALRIGERDLIEVMNDDLEFDNDWIDDAKQYSDVKCMTDEDRNDEKNEDLNEDSRLDVEHW